MGVIINMKYSSFYKRAKAYLFDYLILSIPIMIVTSMIVFKFFPNTSSLNVYPFILLMLMFCPYFIFGYLVVYPIKSDIVLVLGSIIIIIFLESIIYTLMEFLCNGQTIGKKYNNIYLYNSSIFRIFIRNILKSASKYLMCIPYFPALVTKEKQTAYDLLLGTHIIDK